MRSIGVTDGGVPFFCLLFLGKQEKKVRRRAQIPAAPHARNSGLAKTEYSLSIVANQEGIRGGARVRSATRLVHYRYKCMTRM